MNSRSIVGIAARLQNLSIASSPLRFGVAPQTTWNSIRETSLKNATSAIRRPFSSTASRGGNWLLPTAPEKKRSRKGRPRVPTGGSSRGTTMVWGDYGLRMCDHHRRVSAAQLKNGEEAIKVRLKGMRYRLYKRVCASIGVYTKGNEARMGKGKGSFDHWASRIAVSKVIFELKGEVHEQVARDAFRLAGNKMPGLYEFVKKGDAPVVGITKLDGITMEELKRPRRKVPLPMPGELPITSSTVSTSLSPEA
ncbi:Ribosomal protein L16p/L10e [Glarea lozoyensis ATCC 20868]|uniref:Ribosomal protein L16p/L10e n=2 Tax=Glarea lozoyensis TaxID=101852 RepID=S3CYK6_GLAL2|nr:Ribosomal protein L16p/L10e [Glarea lozoyensis ATCC 20868]EPE30680.1 Ribosomal protein L16p/L10e [Glarea lozoyensis ATCC 20868]